MITILIISVIALIVFNIWNLFSLNKLRTNSNNTEKEMNDSKYYEIKYKVEFLIAFFTVMVALVGFLGYTSYQKIKDEIKSEFDKEVVSIKEKLKNAENEINSKDSLFNNLVNKTKGVSTDISAFESNIKNQWKNLLLLENKIDVINNKNIIKQNYYIVPEISYKYDKNKTGWEEIYFRNLITNLNDKLPTFELPPIVIPISGSNVIIEIIDISQESFYAGFNASYGVIDTVKFSLVIMEK